jgi:quinoprotein glucose dehydrogenase
VTTGYRLVALNAKTGAMISTFGTAGVVDLKIGAVKGRGEQIDLERGEIGVHSTPAIVRDVAIIGSSFREGATVSTHNNTKGLVRAYDVRTGKLLWTFNTIPRPGEFGNDTWENESWATRSSVSSIYRSRRRRRTSTAVIAPATISLPRAWCAST